MPGSILSFFPVSVMETALLLKVTDADLSVLLSSATEQGWAMSDARAGLSWTPSELMGEALIPDTQEHSMGVSMETNDVS